MRAFAVTLLVAACTPSPSNDTGDTQRTPAAGTETSAVVPTATAQLAVIHPNAATKSMVKIPGGTFTMGRSDGHKGEAPVHDVTVAPFEIDVLEVTVADYRACVDAGKCPVPKPDEFCNYEKPDRSDHPINCVGFDTADAYCAFAGKRLPTEAEWERAARGDDGRRYPWGNEPPNADRICWNRLKEKLGTCPVGSRPKGVSPFGVQDMSGNVNEWTSSKHCKYSEPACTTEDRTGRGGSWDYTNPDNVTATSRGGGPPGHAKDLIGFRCAK